jgi:large subunit ribosomal protein L9
VVTQAESMRRAREVKETRDRDAAQAVAVQIASRALEIKVRAGEGGKLFGSVTATDVAEALEAQTGIEIDRRKVVLAEPIREVGDSEVTVKLHPDVVVAVAVQIVAE